LRRRIWQRADAGPNSHAHLNSQAQRDTSVAHKDPYRYADGKSVRHLDRHHRGSRYPHSNRHSDGDR
jgi:hypothetical protein